MEFEVNIEITYKYHLFSVIESNCESDVRKQVNESFKLKGLKAIENEWCGFEEPIFVSDMKIISIEEC